MANNRKHQQGTHAIQERLDPGHRSTSCKHTDRQRWRARRATSASRGLLPSGVCDLRIQKRRSCIFRVSIVSVAALYCAARCLPTSRLGSWQARRESNPQPAVLETAALPIELLAYRIVLTKVTSPFFTEFALFFGSALSQATSQRPYGVLLTQNSGLNQLTRIIQ